MNEHSTLDTLAVGEQARIVTLQNLGGMRRRLLDIGFITGTLITCVGQSPSKDPRAYRVRGAVIAIRNADAAKIWITPERMCPQWA